MDTLAESTRSVADGFNLLRQALAESSVPDPLVIERLERAAQRQLGELGPTTQGFEPDVAWHPATVEGQIGDSISEETIFAEVLADLSTGNALLAAGQAIGETTKVDEHSGETLPTATGLGDSGKPFDGQRLEQAGVLLTRVADGLFQRAREGRVRRAGFEPVQPSIDLQTAAARLTDQVSTTLEDLASAAGGVVTEAITKAFEWAPDRLTEVIDDLGNKLKLGERGQRLLGLGLRAIERALSALHGLIPLESIAEMRDELNELRGRFDSGDPAPAVLGWIIGVEDIRAEATRLARPSGSIAAIDQAVEMLRALGERFASLMTVVSGIVTALGMATGLIGVLGVAIPHLPVIAAGAFMLVVAAVVLIGTDYTDTRLLPDFVTGVRSILRTAWDTHEPSIS
jgi:hypothetical protein